MKLEVADHENDNSFSLVVSVSVLIALGQMRGHEADMKWSMVGGGNAWARVGGTKNDVDAVNVLFLTPMATLRSLCHIRTD